jgi:hypothetical protein
MIGSWHGWHGWQTYTIVDEISENNIMLDQKTPSLDDVGDSPARRNVWCGLSNEECSDDFAMIYSQ